MATKADAQLPATADQGCASGEFGTAKTRNAVAPSGAISYSPGGSADPCPHGDQKRTAQGKS